MFAIVELGGKQYRVQEKDILRVEKLETETGKTAVMQKVLLLGGEGPTKIGTPYITGASVELKVIKNGKGDKVRIFKMKAKKRYRKTKNHRQPFSEVEITGIKA